MSGPVIPMAVDGRCIAVLRTGDLCPEKVAAFQMCRRHWERQRALLPENRTLLVARPYLRAGREFAEDE